MSTRHRSVRLFVVAILFAAALAAFAPGRAVVAQQISIQTAGAPSGLPIAGTPMSSVTLNGSGLIVGQVIDAGTNRGVPGAIVSLGGSTPAAPTRGAEVMTFTQVIAGGGGGGPVIMSGGPQTQVPRVLTDAEGRFAFRYVPKGSFNLTATKAGYLDGAYGRLRPNGPLQQLNLEEAEREGDVKVRLFKTASISGTILDDVGEPLVGATVRAYRRTLVSGRKVLNTTGQVATTDDRGLYRLSGLMQGEYIVAVQSVQTSVPANLQLTGALPVDLLETLLSAGTVNAAVGMGGTQVTPDGRFLLQSGGRGSPTALSPDEAGRVLVHPTQYYPAAHHVGDAAPITIGSGEDRTGVDMLLRLVPTANITGRLTGPDGPAANWVLHLVPSDSGDLSADPDVATAVTDANGEFAFLAVPAGQYVIQTIRAARGAMGGGLPMIAGDRVVAITRAVAPGGAPPAPAPPQARPTQPTLYAAVPVAVTGQNVTDVGVMLREGMKISGRLEYIGSAERPPESRVQTIVVMVEAADGKQRSALPSTRLEPNGTFTLTGLLPGKYVLRLVNPPGGWFFRGAAQGGADLSDAPFEVSDRDITGVTLTLVDRPTELSGVVKAPNGSSDVDAAVVVFPADNRLWMQYGVNPRRMQIRRPSATGAYSFRALPAGDYYVVAFSDELAGDWQSPQFLDALTRAGTRITLNEGETKTQDLVRQNVRPPGLAPEPAPAAALVDRGPSAREIDSPDGSADQQAPPPVRDPPRPPAGSPQTPRDARQMQTAGTARVTGRVLLDEASQQPARRARVTLRNTETRAERAATTDDTGRFVLASVPAGNYSLTASKAAYLTAYYGSPRPGRGPGTPLVLSEAETVDNITLRLARGAVIAGALRDDFGQPIAGSPVVLQQSRVINGVRTLVQAPGTQSRSVTDDRGAFRFYGLMPGSYVVSSSPLMGFGFGGDLRQLSASEIQTAVADVQRAVTTPAVAGSAAQGARAGQPPATPPPPPPGRTVGYSQVYYPGTPNYADAGSITVAIGQEQLGIDFAMRSVPTAKIQGTITGADGQPAGGVQISLQQPGAAGSSPITVLNAAVRTMPDGTFTATNVTPGHYTLLARTGGGGARGQAAGDVVRFAGGGGGGAMFAPMGGPGGTHWASIELDINGEDLSNVALTLQPGMTVAGRVALAGRATPADLTQLSLRLEPTGQTSGLAMSVGRADADGKFSIAGLIPGTYNLRINWSGGGGPGAPPWLPRSAVTGGVDILDTPLEIRAGGSIDDLVVTFTDQLSEIAGSIRDAAGKPAPGFTIVAFSTNRQHWSPNSRRMSQTQPSSDGKFRIMNLPAGEYFMAALTELEPGDWGDPSFMEAVAAAAFKITVAEGERKMQDLKIAG